MNVIVWFYIAPVNSTNFFGTLFMFTFFLELTEENQKKYCGLVSGKGKLVNDDRCQLLNSMFEKQ